ncbi:MAG: 16S rRNA (adenine(1518)-N(6)/adenine(1519)-N(6))-dimethyltransferase RsmA [Verrucomicrobiae bacterium]|nr:16S rRNA (adenine(1518)-N(6)/adenine(1519)-N(6))-dimethyltransferase RsmA [Verrucomicrobiae bacterium]
MTLTEIRQLLSERGIRLSKSLGQNFLHDRNQLRRIVEAAELAPRDKVIEVGPGLGQLTELLVARAGTVLAIEKDARLVQLLHERFGAPAGLVQTEADSSGHVGAGLGALPSQCPAGLVLIHADALEFFRTQRRGWRSWKMVSNLPFSVASPILVEVAQLGACPRRLVVTVQFEVAQRLTAVPARPEYGVLTLMVGLTYAPVTMFKIPAGCFFPTPNVDAACIVLERRSPPLLPAAQRLVFVRVVKRAFSQRRKMMFKLLKHDWPEDKLARAFDHAGLGRAARAEQVGLEGFVELTRALCAES